MANTCKVKTELKKAFDSANSLEEMLVAFKNMESRFKKKELGYECLRLAQELDSAGENPKTIIRYGERALNIFLRNKQENLLLIICPLHLLLANVCYRSNKYKQSLRYFKFAEENLDKLDHEKDGVDFVMHSLLVTTIQLELCKVYSAMGERERDKAAFHMEKALKVMERMSHDKECVELGDANTDVCKAYKAADNYKAALPFGLKALEIYWNYFGYNSVEVVRIRSFLGVIYCKLGEQDKAVEQNQSYFSVLRSIGHAELIDVETEKCNVMIENGKYGEAMKGLKAVVSNFITKEADRGVALVCMGRAFCYMEKFDKAKKYMEIAHKILEKEHMNPFIAAIGFGDMSVLYEMMCDFETAVSLIMRVLEIPELPQKLLVDSSTRLFSLIMLSGKEEEGITYLEDVVEKLKESLGAQHSQVGYCYVNLGRTCHKSGRVSKSLQYFALAKDVMDVSLGPNHLDSLKTSHKVAKLYKVMRRYDEAIAIQEQVVQGLRDLVPGEEAFMGKAVRKLEEIKERKNSWCSIL